MVRSKAKIIWVVVLLAAVVVLVSCTDDQCPSCPKPEVEPDYHVQYCCESRPPELVAYTYSLKYGNVVDSAFYGDDYGAFWDAAFSDDGSYTYYTKTVFGLEEPDSWTWVTDTRTGDTLAICAGKGGREIEVSPDGQYLLVSESRMLTLFRLPNLQVIHFEDWTPETDGFGQAAFHPVESEFYFTKGKRGQDTLFVSTYDSSGVTSIGAHPTFNTTGDAVHPSLKTVSPDGRFLIIDAGIFLGPKYFQVLDTDSFSIVHETQIPSWRLHTDHAWHLDGKRVFMPFRGGFDAPDIGGIDVYDITTNTLQYYITSDEISMDNEQLQPLEISFTPDGNELVILNAMGSIPIGSILVLDFETRLLTQRFDHIKQGYYSYAMVLIPIDWENDL
jgi:DNA-binding beta-propeller fold protein YncE